MRLIMLVITFAWLSTGVAKANNDTPIQKQLAIIESSAHGKLGVYAINTGNHHTIQYHANERFPLCSTSKVMGVAAILKKSMAEPTFLQQRIYYKKSDLIAGSPTTKKYVTTGMSIFALSKAAITLSDNTAINLLMRQTAGPTGVTAFARRIGDPGFRLDRWEPALNTAIPGDWRDTTTPFAMGDSLQKLVLGHALAATQRHLLKTWLINSKTGSKRIRASTPNAWRVGDKTGTCAYGTTNDVGIIWGPSGQKIVLAIYFTQQKKDAPMRDDVIAAVTRAVWPMLTK